MDLRQVRAIVTDSKVLSSLEPTAVSRYLRQTGWTGAHERRTGVVWTRQMSDGVAMVFVPKDQDFADYPIRMTEALAALAVVEDRSQLAILVDLLEHGEVRCPECGSEIPVQALRSAALASADYDDRCHAIENQGVKG